MALRPYKRARTSRTRRTRLVKSRVKRRTYRTKNRLNKRIKSVVYRMAESKEAYRMICTEQQLTQNQVLEIDSNPLETYLGTQGDRMPVDQNSTNNGNRIGNSIYVKGLKCRILLEADHKFPSTTFKLFLVRNKEQPDGGIDKATMFERLQTTAQFPVHLDYIDTNKVDIMFCKTFRPKMPNAGTTKSLESGADYAHMNELDTNIGKAIVTDPRVLTKFYVPFNRTINYRDRDGTNGNCNLPVWNHRYRWVMVSASGYGLTDGTMIGRVTMTQKMLFKDV